MHTLTLASEQDTLALGAALAQRVRPGDVIALSGPLGAGKTTFARGFIQSLSSPDEEVVSPTFTLVQIYDSDLGSIWHFDLYRLEKADDALELGFEDALASGICLIEWPERLGTLLPANHLRVKLALLTEGRSAEVSGGTNWTDRLAALENHACGT
jgi:tRNA threonylcarbamoyladenosine biosynthesis protein TsaE